MKKPHHLSKKIYQYTVNGIFVREYESTKEAAEILNVSRETIALVLRKVNKTAKGFQFTYEKVARMPMVDYVRHRMINVSDLQKKRTLNATYQDMGIVDNPTSRNFGRRKIIIGKMEVYARPETPVEDIVNKFCKAI